MFTIFINFVSVAAVHAPCSDLDELSRRDGPSQCSQQYPRQSSAIHASK